MSFVEQKEFKDELVEREMYGLARIEKISDTRGQAPAIVGVSWLNEVADVIWPRG